jgi:hypothetical protein
MDAIRYGVRRAINEMLSIVSCQWQNGMLPHIRFVPGESGYRPDAADWDVRCKEAAGTALRTSGITQPPVLGLCLSRLYSRLTPDEAAALAPDILRICEGICRFHHWLLTERDPHREKLAVCLHPWETGTDNSPAMAPLIEETHTWIELAGLNVDTYGRMDTRHVPPEQRPTGRDYFTYFGLISLFKRHTYDQRAIVEETPFLWQDVLFNTLLSISLTSMANLLETLDEQGLVPESKRAAMREMAREQRTEGQAVASTIREKLWHPGNGLFYGLDLRNERQVAIATVSSLMPLLGGAASDRQALRLIAHLTDPSSFATPVSVPSTPLNSPHFDPKRYWSGPAWPVTNWLLIEGLKSRRPDLAEKLRQSTLAMIAEGQKPESYREAATRVLMRNSYGEQFTTPSRQQYTHGWLWDSALVAMSWPLIADDVGREKQESEPGFWEYFDPLTGEPLGAAGMSWTASLFLEMLEG